MTPSFAVPPPDSITARLTPAQPAGYYREYYGV